MTIKNNVMKKLIIGCLCCLLCVGATISANAQLPTGMLGQAVGKAAKKMASQAADKVADEAAKRAENALGQDRQTTQNRRADAEVNPEENTYREGRVNVTEGGTYASVGEVMAALPTLPTAKELMTYKEAELNGGGLRLVTSPVTQFTMEVAALSMQALQFAFGEADAAQMQRNAAGEAETAAASRAAEAAKYLEPIQPQVERWNEINDKIVALYEELEAAQRSAYKKYASQLQGTEGKARNAVLAKYYGDCVEAQRTAVQQALQLRLKEQLPIAEEIENYLKGIREQNADYAGLLLNYPQLTQVSYFSEVAHLLELPEFDD